MGKLALRIDDLKVDSFATGDEQFRNGTVHGHDTIETEWCTGYGYPGCNVSKQGCQTKNDTCHGSCGCTENCETLAPYC
ncbi:MAG TPA: pinensin family lanthipeptide [Longimicrobium sp.]|nr:pinensin family lanthipeptide [Longimicrobium sp.]